MVSINSISHLMQFEKLESDAEQRGKSHSARVFQRLYADMRGEKHGLCVKTLKRVELNKNFRKTLLCVEDVNYPTSANSNYLHIHLKIFFFFLNLGLNLSLSVTSNRKRNFFEHLC